MADEISIVVRAEDQFSSVLGNFGSIITGIESAINLVGQAFDAALGAITPFIESASESEQAVARLDGVLRATGNAAGLSSADLQNLADSLQGVTRFSDETILGGASLLLTFRNISGETLERTIPAMLDMAEIFGSVDSAAMQLGKALNDPVNMMGALQRAGVTFTEEQKEMIANFVETGNVAAAQNIILTEVENQVGGLAEAMGNTFAGQAEIFRNKLDTIREVIGGALLPVLTGLLERLSAFLNQPEVIAFFDRLADSLSRFLASLDLEGNLTGFLDTIMTAMETGDWTPVWEGIKTAISNGWNFIRPTIDDLFARLFNWMEEQVQVWIDGGGPDRLSNSLTVAMNTTFNSSTFRTNATVAIGSLVNTLGAAFGAVDWTPILSGLGRGIANAFSGLADLLIQGLANQFSGGDVGTFQEDFKNIFWGIIFPPNFIDDGLRKFRDEVVAPMIDGLWDGWDSALNAMGLGGVARWWEDHIIDPIKRLFGISSPSTVFKDIGKNIVQGLIDGIESMLANLIRTVDNLIGIVLDPFGGGGGSNTIGTSSTVSPGSGLGGLGGGLGSSSQPLPGGTSLGQVVNNYYGPVYFMGAGEPGAYFDCPSPNPLMTAGSGTLVLNGR